MASLNICFPFKLSFSAKIYWFPPSPHFQRILRKTFNFQMSYKFVNETIIHGNMVCNNAKFCYTFYYSPYIHCRRQGIKRGRKNYREWLMNIWIPHIVIFLIHKLEWKMCTLASILMKFILRFCLWVQHITQ